MDFSSRRLHLLCIVFTAIVEASSNNVNDTSATYGVRRSRVTGRIVKVYSGSRPEPILCAGEGFQEDPHDCAVFYRCMKSGNKKYTVFRFQCGPGTVYDPETEVCNHPRSTKRTQCGGLPPASNNPEHMNEIEDVKYEIPSPISTSTPSNEIFTKTSTKTWTAPLSSVTTLKAQLQSSVSRDLWDISSQNSNIYFSTAKYPLKSTKYVISTRLPIQTTKETVSLDNRETASEDNICTENGFMGDIQNCRKFYRCVPNQRGGYTRFDFSCSESTIWDDDTQSCNHAWAVKRSRCGRSDIHNGNTSPSIVMTTANTDTGYVTSTKDYTMLGTDRTIQEQLQISYGSKVVQTQTQISNGSVIQNQTQINYGDKINPHKNSTAKQNQTQISHGSAVSQAQTQIDYGNKGLQTQLQVDHSVQSSQIQIQIHESTVKEISTSTHSYSTNGNLQSKCVKSGFMRDSNDCKKFYRCVDNGNGGFTSFEFSCGEGTVWDQSIEACNHAWAVKDCSGKATTAVAPSEQITTKSTQTYHTTTTVAPPEISATEDNDDSGYGTSNHEPAITTTTSTTAQSSQPISNKPLSECQSSGFYGDENDCKIFYRCVDDGKGTFTKYEFKCGEGTVWDPELEACNHAWAVKKCGGNLSSGTAATEMTTNAQPTHSVTQSSTQLTSEISVTQNEDYDTGYGSQNNNDFSTTTSTTKPVTSNNNKGNNCSSDGFMGDETDCKKFYRCVANGDGGFTRYEFTCGEGTVWDPKITACNHAWAVEKCGGNGLTTIHQDISQEIKPTTSTLPVNGASDNDLTTKIPSTTSSNTASKNNCTNSGFMGDPNDCKKFYRCVDNGDGSYIKYEFSCGEGTLWDQEIEACNHAWAVKKCGGLSGTSSTSSGHIETTSQSYSTLEDDINEGYPSVDTNADTSIQSTTQAVTEANKRPISNNSCTSSGFIGDKIDCKKFYRCVDDGNGSFTRYEFNCGEGTLWDQNIEACNHAWAVKNCRYIDHNTTHAVTSGNVHTTTSATPESEVYPQHTEKPDSAESTTDADTASGHKCKSEGFYGDQNDCKKFYRCVNNGKGSYTKYEFTCGPGTAWDNKLQTCDHASIHKNCALLPSTTTSTVTENSSMSPTTETQHLIETTHIPTSSTGYQCTSEGFFPHPNDCKKFIRCTNNDKGGYTKYEFSCGGGTVWVQDILACDHDTKDEICSIRTTTNAPVITGESSQTTEKLESDHTTTLTSTTIQHTTDKQDDEYNGNPDADTSSQEDVCTSEGFYVNRNDCRRFYRCVDNGQGGYTKYEFTCGEGTAWDSEIQNCNHIDQVKSCQGTNSTQPIMHEEENGQTTESFSSTTKTSTTTADNLQTSTTEGTSTVKSTTSSEGSSQTSAGGNKCEKEGYFGDNQDCKKFYRCVDNGKGGYTKYDFDCGEGTIWDQDVTTCNHPQNVAHPSCTQDQTTPSSNSSPTGSSESTSSTPENGTQSSSNCTQDETSKRPENTKVNCTKAGYFANPDDCKKFYRCVDWDGDGKRFSVYHFECGEGTIWDPVVETCNHEESVYPPRDCSNAQAQNENQPESTEGTTSTTQESTTSTTDKTTTEIQTTSQQPTSQQSTTLEQTTTQQQTTIAESTTTEKSSTTEQTTTHQPITSESTTTQGSTSSIKTTTQQSTTLEQTTTQQSTTTDQTTTQQPTNIEQTEQTNVSQQTTEQATTTQSTTEQITPESTTIEQVTEQSTTSESTTSTQSSTAELTTQQSTTEQSTTTESTTASSTQQLTTEQQTTEDSLTSDGTTTEQFTDSSTTEQEQSTENNSSDKVCPETDDTQNLFVCPTSFRRHPKYCNLFYQCDEDDDTHDVRIAVFTCPNNTIYDENQTRCVDENKADKKCTGEIAQKRRFKRLNRYYKEPIVASGGSYACSTAGYLPFEKESECSPAFLKCKIDKSNHLNGYVYQCPTGYIYWSISKRCEPSYKVKDCKRSQNDWTERWQIPVETKNVAYK